jgi:hypothetical protein
VQVAVAPPLQVTVLEVDDVLPQASRAVHVLVCEREQLLLCTGPSVAGYNVDAPHASLAVAVPSAALISDEDGLGPNVVVVPFAVITGGVLSTT